MNKLVRNGKVAVLYSPGYGAGWSTWCDGSLREYLTMDKELAEAVESGNIDKAIELAEAKAADKTAGVYTGGARDLCIEWVPVGSAFEIVEYDGNESVRLFDISQFTIA